MQAILCHGNVPSAVGFGTCPGCCVPLPIWRRCLKGKPQLLHSSSRKDMSRVSCRAPLTYAYDAEHTCADSAASAAPACMCLLPDLDTWQICGC